MPSHPIQVLDVLTHTRRIHQAFGYELLRFDLKPAEELLPFVRGEVLLVSRTTPHHELGAGEHTIRLMWQNSPSGEWLTTCGPPNEPGHQHTSFVLEDAIIRAFRGLFTEWVMART